MLLITTPNIKPEVKSLITTAQALGWSVYNDGWRVPDRVKYEKGAVYGEPLFCETIAEQMHWTLRRNPIDWLSTLPFEYISRNIVLTDLGVARKLTEEKFIKPATDKIFDAKIYASGVDFPSSLDDDITVIMSDVMRFTSKYRCIVKNREVISECCYFLHTRPMQSNKLPEQFNLPQNYDNNHKDVITFVNKMLQDERVKCIDSFVIDVGRFDKDKYAVITDKPVHNTPIYGCDPVAVLDAIKTACVSFGRN
jgi:hypothetical protein